MQFQILLLLLPTVNCRESGHNSSDSGGIKLVDWKWHELRVYVIVAIFLIVACILKTLYHHIHVLVAYVPESNVLILLGVGIGLVVHFLAKDDKDYSDSVWSMSPELFFLVLLPPIMLEAAYSLYDRAFIDNFGCILLLALGGTLANFLMIGFGLYAAGLSGAMGSLALPLKPCLLFASLIVAVDPVAVLAIFNDIGVEQSLYYLVFGESLFNDAITVVLYNTMHAFMGIEMVTGADIALGFASFFTISFGGISIGIVCGIISSLLTRFTDSTRVVEPLVLATLAYAAYAVADLCGWSGLLAIIACGLIQAAYAFHNISSKSRTTIKYFAKMSASVGEAIIFLYLGIELISSKHRWHWPFAIWTLALCISARFVVTFAAGWAINRFSNRPPIPMTELVVIAVGGLRGAVAFALADLVSGVGQLRELFLTTTMFVIMFTCLVLGLAIKPIVNCLHIQHEKKRPTSVLHEVVRHSIDHLAAGIEDIAGRRGDNHFRELLGRFDDSYIRPLLQREPQTHDEQIVEIYHRVGFKLQLLRSYWHREPSSQQQEKLEQLTPALSAAFLRDLNKTGGDTDAVEPMPAHRRRLGEGKLSVSENPNSMEAMDVRRVMHDARQRSQLAPARLSKALHSDPDMQQRLQQIRKRTADGIRILRQQDKQQLSSSAANSGNSDDELQAAVPLVTFELEEEGV